VYLRAWKNAHDHRSGARNACAMLPNSNCCVRYLQEAFFAKYFVQYLVSSILKTDIEI
jgi:hypothetical protein